MPRQNLQAVFQFQGDLIDAERLILRLVCGLCEDDVPFFQILCMDTVRRVLHLQLKAAVALLSHEAGLAVCQLADAVIGKFRFIGLIQAWDHSVHHLGVTSTAVMPPVHVICVFPGGSSGKSSDRMVLLQKPPAL